MAMFKLVGSVDLLEPAAPDVEEGSEVEVKKKEMSAACLKSACRNVATAILRSFGMHLIRSGTNTDDARKKLLSVVNAFINAGDLDRNDVSYFSTHFINHILATSVGSDEIPYSICSDSYADCYMVITGALDYAESFSWNISKLEEAGLTEHEVKLAEDYNKASRAYYEARGKFLDYFREANREAAIDIVRKHTSLLAQHDPMWLTGVSRCLGIATAPVAKVTQDDAKLVRE